MRRKTLYILVATLLALGFMLSACVQPTKVPTVEKVGTRDVDAYFDMKIRGVPENYKVYKKPLPANLIQHPDFGSYYWMPNFGFKDENGGIVTEGFEYQVLIEANPLDPEYPGIETIVFWDGKAIQPVQKMESIKIGEIDYISFILTLPDPPCGWR